MRNLQPAAPLSCTFVLVLASPLLAQDRPLPPSITVVGSGELSAAPDTAEVQIGVVTQAPSAADALRANSAAMEKLFKTLADRGITKKDIQTSNFNVSPQYRQRPREQSQEIAGYQVTNQVRVKVRRLPDLGRVLDEAVTGGANQLYGINFSIAETAPLLDKARLSALADARRKAELYAGAAGVKLTRVLYVQETPPAGPRPMTFGRAALGMEASVPVAPGELDLHATLTVTYAIE